MNKFLLVGLLTLFSSLSLMAQVQLNRAVFSNGAVNSTAGNIRLQGSIGQALIGPAQANGIIADGGFWASASACGDPVTSLADSGPGSLREALSCASFGDTITFDIDGTIVLTSEIEILQGVTINADGRDILLDGNGTNRIFLVNAPDPVLFRNLTFQNGSISDFGGAIIAFSPIGAVNCSFQNNTADNGGAIGAGADSYFQNCRFANNQSNFQAGVIQMAFGRFTFDNCVFSNNQGTTLGGALFASQTAQVVIANSTLAGNSAETGGAIFKAADATISMSNSIVSNNTASLELGDIFTTGLFDLALNNIIGDPTNSGITIGTNNNVSLDPLLSNIPNGDLSLQPFSPAHGNADPALFLPDTLDANKDGDVTSIVNFDFMTTVRGSTGGCNFDIGAIETAQGSLTVINTNDSGVGSLRSHMECAIGNPNINLISFAIPGAGPHTINLASELPFINTPNLVIDGTSQAGSTFESPTIILDGGSNIPSIIALSGDNTSILGMGMRNVTNRVLFVGDAEFVTISGNTLFTNAGQDQIALFGANNCNIFSNRIGIDIDGTVSTLERPFLWFDNCNNNRVSLNTIAGTGGSLTLGITNGSSGNEVFDNLIGTTADGQDIGGGAAIFLANASGNAITNNTLANHNTGIQVVEGSSANLFSPNNFVCNSLDGISIEAGSQDDIAPPVFTSLSPGAIAGIAIGAAAIDIYIQDDNQCPDAACQGSFLGSTTADNNGDWTFSDPAVIEGVTLTAIQTDANNNSSAFALCSLVACDLSVAVVSPLLINCLTPQITLQATSNSATASFAWTGPNNFSSNDQNPSVSEAGLYILTVSDIGNCIETDSVTVTGDFQEPDISLVGAQLDCLNPTTFLGGNSTTPGASFLWTGPNNFSSNERSPEISEPGTYTFTVTGPNGCTSSGNSTVIRDETIAPIAGFDFIIGNNLNIILQSTASGDPASHFYDFGNGETSTDPSPSVSYQSAGLKTITQIVSNQCGADTLIREIELAPPAEPVSFCFPEKLEGATGDTLSVPIKVTNFNNVASLQMSIHLGDPAVAQILGVSDFALPQLDQDDFNQPNDTTISMAWFFGSATSLPDSAIIFTVQVLLNGTEAVCTPIFIDDVPVFVEVGVLDQNVNSIVSVPYNLVTGEVCILPFADISGRVFRETGNGLKEVMVACTDQMPFITGPDGKFEFLELPTGTDYLIEPSRNTNPLEGVTAIDLALIQRHILSLQFLDSPYKIIAADVDLSNSVGAIDLANIQRLILGKTDVFPNNANSWRFVDANYQFTNENNPLSEPFPEDRLIVDLLRDVTEVDFVGMKLGDVNGSALGRPTNNPIDLVIVEKTDGRIRTIEFRSKENQSLSAYQFDINFDQAQMKLLDILPGSLPGMNEGYFATHKITEGSIPTLWFDPSGNTEGYQLEAGQVLFSLQFQVGAEVTASLHDRIWTGARSIPAIAYTGSGQERQIGNIYPQNNGIELETTQRTIRLEPLWPNPFMDQAQMRFYLPETAQVNIQIQDALGRTLKKIQGSFDAGEHQIDIRSEELGNPGWYVVQMQSGDFSTSRRIILQR